MDIIVGIKPVFDPELPPAKFAVDGKKNEVTPSEGMPFVMSPYDALAVEAALRIKEAKGGKVTILTLATKYAKDVVRKAVAMGADEGFILTDSAFEGSDGFATAYTLTQAVKKIGTFDLILRGRQAADWDVGMVGSVMAEYLGIPVVIRAKSIGVLDGKLKVERVVAVAAEVTETESPISRNSLVRLYIPSYQRTCEYVTGADPAEVADLLAEKILAINLERRQYRWPCRGTASRWHLMRLKADSSRHSRPLVERCFG